jgi:hypothetical protein
MTLIPLYNLIRTHYPEINCPTIEDYCTNADQPRESSGNFHTGYNSLKWALMAINDIDPAAVKNVIRDIIFEYIARQLTIERLEYHILSFCAVKPFKQLIYANQPKEIADTDMFPIHTIAGKYKIIINLSTRILTGQIFKKTRVDAIIFRNTEIKSAGFIFRPNPNCELNQLVGFKNYLYDQLSSIEPGWKTVGDDINMIANFGSPSKTPSNIEADDILQLVIKYFV